MSQQVTDRFMKLRQDAFKGRSVLIFGQILPNSRLSTGPRIKSCPRRGELRFGRSKAYRTRSHIAVEMAYLTCTQCLSLIAAEDTARRVRPPRVGETCAARLESLIPSRGNIIVAGRACSMEPAQLLNDAVVTSSARLGGLNVFRSH